MFVAKDFEPATKAARAAVAAGPLSSESRWLLARALAATGEFERAFDEYAEASRLAPKNGELMKELSAVALRLHRDVVALEFAREGVRLSPTDKGVAVAFVKALTRVGDLAAANQAIAPLVARHGASSDVLVVQAALQTARGDRSSARATYQRVLQADRDALEALEGLVALELTDRQAARVLARVNQAVASHPKDPAYLVLSARVLRATGNASRAQDTLRSILDIDPAHTEAALLSGDILASQNRRDEARRAVEQALALRPSSLDLQVWLANSFEAAGQVDEARTRYERIIATNKHAHWVSARLAALYTNHGGNLDAALGLARTAKQNLPNDPSVSDVLGWVHVRKGLPVLAIPHLQDAARDEPANALFRYHLGMAYQGARQYPKAREELAKALKLDPDFPGAADARAALGSQNAEPRPR